MHQPTWALIDIDPGADTNFDAVLVLARLYRTALEHLDVAGMPEVTGRRGIQIRIPVRPGHTFADTRKRVEAVSQVAGRTVPELVSRRWYRHRRGGLARLDYTRNAINKTWSRRSAHGRLRARRCPSRSPGTNSTTRT